MGSLSTQRLCCCSATYFGLQLITILAQVSFRPFSGLFGRVSFLVASFHVGPSRPCPKRAGRRPDVDLGIAVPHLLGVRAAQALRLVLLFSYVRIYVAVAQSRYGTKVEPKTKTCVSLAL